MTAAAVYEQARGARVMISGRRGARGYFAREYGPVAVTDTTANLELCFGPLTGSAATLVGRHKAARWRIALHPPATGLSATIDVRGAFGLPMVQSLVVEPLIAVAAARCGQVVIPGAGVLPGEGGGVLLVGTSGVGKTSVVARALAADVVAIADDQVVLTPDGRCHRFERRMRLYPDLESTAPVAWARLTRSRRSALRGLALLKTLTAGGLAPPLMVPSRSLGPVTDRHECDIARIVLVTRRNVHVAGVQPADPATAAAAIHEGVHEARMRLTQAADAGWTALLEEIASAERRLLDSICLRTPATALEIPSGWPADRAVGRIAQELGIA